MKRSRYLACPTEVVAAPVATVWQLLTNIAGWGEFFDVRVTSVEPTGTARPGQRMTGESGPRWLDLRVSLECTLVDQTHHKLELDGWLPLGMTVHEAIDCIPLDDARTRVNYHCDFGFPSGWRGLAQRILLGRGLKTGPIDSLSRLKRAAETLYSDQRSGNNAV